MKGRVKITLKTDKELSEFVHTKLRKGKGSLWLEGVMSNHSVLNVDSSDAKCNEDPHSPPPRRCERHLYLMKNVLEFGKFLKN